MVLIHSQVVDLLHAVTWTVCMLVLYQKYIQFHKRKVFSEFKTFICRTFNKNFGHCFDVSITCNSWNKFISTLIWKGRQDLLRPVPESAFSHAKASKQSKMELKRDNCAHGNTQVTNLNVAQNSTFVDSPLHNSRHSHTYKSMHMQLYWNISSNSNPSLQNWKWVSWMDR